MLSVLGAIETHCMHCNSQSIEVDKPHELPHAQFGQLVVSQIPVAQSVIITCLIRTHHTFTHTRNMRESPWNSPTLSPVSWLLFRYLHGMRRAQTVNLEEYRVSL
jgi:hypothetical protein